MVFFATGLRRAVEVSTAAIVISLGAAGASLAQSLTLNGAGATFPNPLYQRYFNQFKQETGIQVNYESIGSGGGIRQFTAGTVDFGATDAVLNSSQRAAIEAKHGGWIAVPTAGGAVSVVFNVPGVNNLNLSRTVLPAIFSGEITRWNDPRIAAGNKGVTLPEQPIRVVVRSDGSGTSYIFSNALATISPSFRQKVGSGSTTPKWPASVLSGKGNPGVAATVQQTQFSIGYVESGFASANKMNEAAVENKARKFVKPTLEASNKAFEGSKFPADNFLVEGDPDGAQSYPIVGLTWILLYPKYDAKKEAAINKLVEWILTKGQAINGSIEYTRIPSAQAQKVLQQVKQNVSAK